MPDTIAARAALDLVDIALRRVHGQIPDDAYANEFDVALNSGLRDAYNADGIRAALGYYADVMAALARANAALLDLISKAEPGSDTCLCGRSLPVLLAGMRGLILGPAGEM